MGRWWGVCQRVKRHWGGTKAKIFVEKRHTADMIGLQLSRGLSRKIIKVGREETRREAAPIRRIREELSRRGPAEITTE